MEALEAACITQARSVVGSSILGQWSGSSIHDCSPSDSLVPIVCVAVTIRFQQHGSASPISHWHNSLAIWNLDIVSV